MPGRVTRNTSSTSSEIAAPTIVTVRSPNVSPRCPSTFTEIAYTVPSTTWFVDNTRPRYSPGARSWAVLEKLDSAAK